MKVSKKERKEKRRKEWLNILGKIVLENFRWLISIWVKFLKHLINFDLLIQWLQNFFTPRPTTKFFWSFLNVGIPKENIFFNHHLWSIVFSIDLVSKEELNLMLVKLVKVRWVWANVIKLVKLISMRTKAWLDLLYSNFSYFNWMCHAFHNLRKIISNHKNLT